MQKKIFLLLVFLLLSSCGYEAIYSKKNSLNYNFSISKLNFVGDRDINLKMKEKLTNYTLDKKNKNFKIKIYSTSVKSVAANDTTGDATSFKNTVVVNVEVSKNDTVPVLTGFIATLSLSSVFGTLTSILSISTFNFSEGSGGVSVKLPK